jgi:glucosamine-6-phosphate deaminase
VRGRVVTPEAVLSDFGGVEDEVPHHVITQGLATIGQAEHLVLTASGGHQAAAIAAAVEGPVSSSCPA